MNRKHGQSQRNMSSHSRPQRTMSDSQPLHNSQNYGQHHDQDTEQFGPSMNRSMGRNFSGRSSYMNENQMMDAERSSSSAIRDNDYDFDGSTYGNHEHSPRSMDRSRNLSRQSFLDEDRLSSDRNFDRQRSSPGRFGYPSNMNAWSGADPSPYDADRTSDRMGQSWSGSDMDEDSYGRVGPASFSSLGESTHRADRAGSQSFHRGFYGKGPKGYKRSDERIKEDVCEALARHPRVDASDIEVKVEDTIVTLSGTVDSREVRRAAEMAIENLSGVEDVRNDLKVKKMGERVMESSSHSSSTTPTSSSKSTKSTNHI